MPTEKNSKNEIQKLMKETIREAEETPTMKEGRITTRCTVHKEMNTMNDPHKPVMTEDEPNKSKRDAEGDEEKQEKKEIKMEGLKNEKRDAEKDDKKENRDAEKDLKKEKRDADIDLDKKMPKGTNFTTFNFRTKRSYTYCILIRIVPFFC